MPPKPSITLTAAELRLMKLLWHHGECAVAKMVTVLNDDLAYTSVLTTIRVLESKGYVTHRQHGRAFLYAAVISEQEASRSELRHVLGRFFNNSRERLMLSLLGDGDLNPEELDRLKQAIAEAPADPSAPESKPTTVATSRSNSGKATRRERLR